MADYIDLGARNLEYTKNPYPLLAQLREQAPVTRVVVDGLPLWLISRYEDVRDGLTDPRFSNDLKQGDEATRAVPWLRAVLSLNHMLGADPPVHTRLRRLVAKAFTPRRIDMLRPRIQQITDELVAAIQPRGHADLLAEFAQPLPVTVLAEILGIPLAEQNRFVDKVNIFAGVDEGDVARIPEANAWIVSNLASLIERKTREQSEQRAVEHRSLLDELIAARDEGAQLTHEELVGTSVLLVIAGYETTANLIANGLCTLLEHPEQYAALRANPGLIPPAIEELLRFESPVKVAPFVRIATTDVTVAGTLIPAHQPVMFAIAAANRDPAQFRNPDRFDISRSEGEHVGFGHGVHYCIGAPLARLEAEIAFTTILGKLPDLALAVPREALAWRHSRVLRGLKHLPVTFQPAPDPPR
jgi:cytochrome P450